MEHSHEHAFMAPDFPNLCLKQNWTTQCPGDSFGFPGLGGVKK